MKNFYTLLFLGLSLLGYSQSGDNVLIETSSNTALVVCGDAITFTIKITNSNSGTLTGITYTSNFPNGMTLESSEYANEGSITEPIFEIPDINGNSSSTFTYTAKGNCTILTEFDLVMGNTGVFTVSNVNNLVYSINNGAIQSIQGASESYNINFPELFVKVKDEDVNLQVGVLEKDADGTVLNREIEVTNSGLGALNEYRLYIDYDANIDFNELRLSTGSVLNPVGTAITSPLGNGLLRLEYIITDFSSIGDGDNKFEQNEKFTFIDTVSLDADDCNDAMQTNYTAVYGCEASFCETTDDQDATSINYISFVQGVPRFTSRTFLVKSGDLCGDPIQLRYEYTNVGSGSIIAEADTGFNLQLTESSEIFRNLGTNSIKINGVALPESVFTSFTRYDFSLNANGLFSSDPDGPGVGLEDIDKDGVYDDLPVGATFTVSVELILPFDTTYIDNIYNEQLTETVFMVTQTCVIVQIDILQEQELI
ncbi:hypothetical protein N7U66_03415 [Lacinutrix neustonica]|uniref:DUF11 domain-containing protein n=1 Tax=Lacinutrix neustonica TaxID=2980107 RepID=A0A9E8SDS7_9FLAO|nr:hypothetical protein [Lacinutrix neustonica]WAC02733.1 hypothetical protein N7U66_03415 [Lacinutrix neustonica]